MTALLAGGLAGLGAWAVGFVLRVGDRRAAGFLPPTRRLSLRTPTWFTALLADADLPVDPAVAWPAVLVIPTGGAVVVLAAVGVGAAVATLVLLVGGPVLLVTGRRGRWAHTVDAALPDALDAVARAVRTGASLPQAIAEVAPTVSGRLGRDLEEIDATAGSGVAFVSCLDRWASRSPTPGVRLASAALALAAESGGRAAEAVDGVAATLRAELAVAGEVRAQSSQARMSALVIAIAPLAFGVLAAGTDDQTASFLLRTPIGSACLVGGITLDVVAAWWMQRITAAPC
jgi:tight adherence protein B